MFNWTLIHSTQTHPLRAPIVVEESSGGVPANFKEVIHRMTKDGHIHMRHIQVAHAAAVYAAGGNSSIAPSAWGWSIMKTPPSFSNSYSISHMIFCIRSHKFSVSEGARWSKPERKMGRASDQPVSFTVHVRVAPSLNSFYQDQNDRCMGFWCYFLACWERRKVWVSCACPSKNSKSIFLLLDF